MIELEEMKRRLNTGFLSKEDFLLKLLEDQKREEQQIIYEKKYNQSRRRMDVVGYYNIPASLDIETTNYAPTKTAYMFICQININGWSTYVRTWGELAELLKEIQKIYKLYNFQRILVIYVHNLGFEGSFIMPRIDRMTSMFAISEHNPAKIDTESGFEFRDSLVLSGLSLEKTGKSVTLFKVKKMTGDFDYSKMRNSKTPLTTKELGYCLHDVTTLTAYIYEQIKLYKDITQIPLTNTGRVRRYIKRHCLYRTNKNGKTVRNKDYADLIHSLNLDPDEYRMLKKGFAGGFTHANHKHADEVFHHVASYDFTSSYPTIMVSEKFPMSTGEKVNYKSWDDYFDDLNDYCILMAVRLTNLDDTPFDSEHYISYSKCIKAEKAIIDNGRIVKADEVVLICTEQDFDIIMKNYEFDGEILAAYRYKKDYLPKELIEALLYFYERKTTLKDVIGMEAEYMLLKGMLNSFYGMEVTSVIRPETTYDKENGWETTAGDYYKYIEKYNKDKDRTSFYPWGVWITAYARHNLWTGILELGDDYLYSDTDSVKVINSEKHQEYFENYNKNITEKIKKVCRRYEIDEEKAEPKSKDGEKKPLGIWDYEGYFDTFKTLGAKRYMVQGFHKPNGDLKADYMITIAGVSKTSGGEFIFSQEDPFGFFEDDMSIPAGFSGKQAVAYTNKPVSAVITDEYGNTEEMHEEGCAYIYETGYKMNLSESYFNYITTGDNGVKPLSKIQAELKCLYKEG